MNDFVSVILPVYNGDRYLKYAIESVLKQTYTAFELIIVNDNSSDNTQNIIDSFSRHDNRIICLRNFQQQGVAKSLNTGINCSKGSVIARIDADDLWEKRKLKIQMERFEQDPDLMLIGTRKILIDAKGDEMPQNHEFKCFSNKQIRKNIHVANLFNHSSVVYRKSVIKKFGHYNENYKNSEDYELWLRICYRVKSEIIPIPLVRYRMHSSSVTSLKLKQQMYYSIRARVAYIFNYGLRGFFTKLFLREVAFLILPYSIITLIRSYRNKKNSYSNG
ncbi:MAG: glycosyltransferase family 2 protein [Bacteroidales bacterium]